MEVWEKRSLPRPPECTHLYSSHDVQELAYHLKTIIKETRKLSFGIDKDEMQGFHRELLCLSRILYQYGRHRAENFFILLKKVEKCAKRFVEMKFYEEISLVKALLPTSFTFKSPFRFPSRKMYDYLLVLAIGAFHLLLQLESYCMQAAQLLMSKIASGHFFASAAVLLACVSRIRSHALDITNSIAEYCDKGAEHAFSLIGASYEGCEKTILNESLCQQLQKHLSVSYSKKKENQGHGATGPEENNFSSIMAAEEDKPSELKKNSIDNQDIVQEGENASNKPKKKKKKKNKKDDQFKTEENNNLCDEDIREKVLSIDKKRKQLFEHSKERGDIIVNAEDIGKALVRPKKSEFKKREIKDIIALVRPKKSKIGISTGIKDIGEAVVWPKKSELKKREINTSIEDIGEAVVRPKKRKLKKEAIGVSNEDIGEAVVSPKESKVMKGAMGVMTEDNGEAVLRLKKSDSKKGNLRSLSDNGEAVVRPKKSKVKKGAIGVKAEDNSEAVLRLKKSDSKKGNVGRSLSDNGEAAVRPKKSKVKKRALGVRTEDNEGTGEEIEDIVASVRPKKSRIGVSIEDIGEAVVLAKKGDLKKRKIDASIEDIGEAVVRPRKRKLIKGAIGVSTDDNGEAVVRPNESKVKKGAIGVSTEDIGDAVVRPKKGKVKKGAIGARTGDNGEAVHRLKKSILKKGKIGRWLSNNGEAVVRPKKNKVVKKGSIGVGVRTDDNGEAVLRLKKSGSKKRKIRRRVIDNGEAVVRQKKLLESKVVNH